MSAHVTARLDMKPTPIPPDHPFALATRDCVLCGNPSVVLGAFTPAASAGYGALAGVKQILYGLCTTHTEDLGTSAALLEGMVLEAFYGSAA